jgi:hypothetical protein
MDDRRRRGLPALVAPRVSLRIRCADVFLIALLARADGAPAPRALSSDK